MKKIIALIMCVALACSFAACGSKGNQDASSDVAASYEKQDINVFMLSGPTGIGAVNMMQEAENGTAADNYKFSVAAQPTEIVSKISNKEADIAAVATNLAATIYNKTEGKVTVLAVNTLGVLNVVTNGDTTVDSLADLKGKTVYTTGQGANPEYIINYLLRKNGVDPSADLKINFVGDGTELLTVFATEPNAVVIAPQPVATSITAKYDTAKIAVDLTKEWEKTASDSALMMGCVIVRNDFLESNPDAVDRFMSDYKKSVEKATSDIDTTADLCEKYGIVAKAAIAKKAIPACNICFVTGSEMKTKLSGYLQVMFEANPTSVGGKLPADDFYFNYTK